MSMIAISSLDLLLLSCLYICLRDSLLNITKYLSSTGIIRNFGRLRAILSNVFNRLLTSKCANVLIPLTETRRNNGSNTTYKGKNPNRGWVKTKALKSKRLYSQSRYTSPYCIVSCYKRNGRGGRTSRFYHPLFLLGWPSNEDCHRNTRIFFLLTVLSASAKQLSNLKKMGRGEGGRWSGWSDE